MMQSSLSEDDRRKISTLIDYNMDVINTNDIFTLFNNLKLIFWKPQDIIPDSRCTFCYDQAKFFNERCDMLACDSCMLELEYQEIDLSKPEDHPLSKFLYYKIRDLMERNFYFLISSDIYFEEFDVKYNTCDICQKIIDNDCEIALFSSLGPISHHKCLNRDGFYGHITNDQYGSAIILMNIDGYVESLTEPTPHKHTHQKF